jgi:hypothetical protein
MDDWLMWFSKGGAYQLGLVIFRSMYLQLEQMPPIEIAHGTTRKSGLMFQRRRADESYESQSAFCEQ